MAVSIARVKAKDTEAQLTVDTLVDGRYTHKDVSITLLRRHLSLILEHAVFVEF